MFAFPNMHFPGPWDFRDNTPAFVRGPGLIPSQHSGHRELE